MLSFIIINNKNNNIKQTRRGIPGEVCEWVFIIFLVNICREVSQDWPVAGVLTLCCFVELGFVETDCRGDKGRNITQTDRQITQETSLGIQLGSY